MNDNSSNSPRKPKKQKLSEVTLQSDDHFRSAFDFASLGMGLVSLEGKWVKVNQSIYNVLGYKEADLIGNHFNDILLPQDRVADFESIHSILEGKTPSYQIEKRFFHKTGKTIWTLLSVSLVCNTSGDPLYYIFQIQDITKQKKIETQLKYQATHDSLTGLINRAEFELRLRHCMTALKSQADQRFMAIVFMDLDGFKGVNDTFGHLIGNQILMEVGWRLARVLRKDDTIARFGGDEFSIILLNLKAKSDVASVAKKILAKINQPYYLENNTIRLSASIGIACYPSAGDTPHDLINNADLALLKAKKAGKGVFEFHSS